MKNKTGISPKLRDILKLRDKAFSGDIKISLSLLGDPPVAGTGFPAKEIRVKVTDAAGNIHDWFSKTITTNALAIVVVGDGTAVQTPATTCEITNGEGSVSVVGSLTWATGDTFTVSIPETTILGYAVPAVSLTVTCV